MVMHPIGEDGLAHIKTQREHSALGCFVNYMLPTLTTALSTHNIKMVVELKQTNNVIEEIVAGIRDIQFANSDTEVGAAAIVNFCAPTNGESCIIFFMYDKAPCDIGTMVKNTVRQIKAALCIIVISHPTGKFPATCIPLQIREADYSVKIESRNTTEPDTDVSIVLITLRPVTPGPPISVPLVGERATRRAHRRQSCPTLVPFLP
jgi:hypothetical protein